MSKTVAKIKVELEAIEQAGVQLDKKSRSRAFARAFRKIRNLCMNELDKMKDSGDDDV